MKNICDIGSRREVFWDDRLVDTERTTAAARLHAPQLRETVFVHDAPWEGDGCDYHNILFDGEKYRMYYLGWEMFDSERKRHGGSEIRVCIAESRDGIRWTRPDVGLCTFNGSKHNNILLDAQTCAFDNFFVYLDDNPACPAGEKFKGIGVYNRELWLFASGDGYRFARTRVICKKGCFDTLNTCHFDPYTGLYRVYLRDFHNIPPSGDRNLGVRDIRVITSRDFHTWTEPVLLDFMGGEDYPLYTNCIFCYPRADHLLVSFPSRYVERSAWTENFSRLCGAQARRERCAVAPRYGLATTDCIFACSRDGLHFKRYDEAFMRPGPEHPLGWVYGDCYPAVGLIETESPVRGADPELSMYTFANHWSGIPADLNRYAIRREGFVSRHAAYAPQMLVTRPFVFDGDALRINFSTSARGSIYITLRTPDGQEYTSGEIFGDATDRTVDFVQGSVSALRGVPVTMECRMSDADIYSFTFGK